MLKKVKYVVGFMFSPTLENVVLIRKRRPDWQIGLLNGIGGKIEANESALVAMSREFKEETGVLQSHWSPLCKIENNKYSCHFFYCVSAKWRDCKTVTDEEIVHFPVVCVSLPSNRSSDMLIYNLNWLIPLAIETISGFRDRITVYVPL